jgi:hypothetical protein
MSTWEDKSRTFAAFTIHLKKRGLRPVPLILIMNLKGPSRLRESILRVVPRLTRAANMRINEFLL